LLRTLCPQISLYLFEKYPGQDHYQDIIRDSLNKQEGDDAATWPVEEVFCFADVVAMNDPEYPGEKQVKNIEVPKNSPSGMPRMLFVRILMENQLQWTKKEHCTHGKLLAAKLNEEMDKKREAGTIRNIKEARDYYFTEDNSWITPEEVKPLGLYMSKSVMRYKIMSYLFEHSDLTQSWASRYPERIHQFFADGLSQTARQLGVADNYHYKSDHYYINIKEPVNMDININAAAKKVQTLDESTGETNFKSSDESAEKSGAVITPEKPNVRLSEDLGNESEDDEYGDGSMKKKAKLRRFMKKHANTEFVV
jgi:hypothetical protein